jgi:Peptidase family M50
LQRASGILEAVSATPILDLEQPLPQKRSKGWRPIYTGFVLGLLLVLILILDDENQLGDWHLPPFGGLWLIPALYVSIAIHELGHLIAGKLAGVKAGGVSLRAFVFSKYRRFWVFRLMPRNWTVGFYEPLVETSGFNLSRFFWMVAAGPIASILLTVLCAVIWTRYGTDTTQWVGSLFWMGLFMVVSSVTPFSEGVKKSDATILWQLVRAPRQVAVWMAMISIQAADAKGVRPREWNLELFGELLSADVFVDEYPSFQLLAYYRRLDEGADALALEHLENALARCGRANNAMLQGLFLEAASASAFISNNPTQARRWHELASKLRKLKSPADVVEAGIAMSEGRQADALRHWEAAKAHAPSIDSGLARFARDKWLELETTCRSGKPDNGTAP